MKIVTWNVQRPTRTGALNQRRLAELVDDNADIYVLTETRDVISMDKVLGGTWHSLSSFPIPNYHKDGETLATIWSKWAIRPVSVSRFSACAEIIGSPVGSLLVYGTVIPWDKDEGFSPLVKPQRWEEHRRQVKVQTSEWEVLSESYPEHQICIAGDFNQHRGVSGSYRDRESVERISRSLARCGLRCITECEEDLPVLSKPLVDHICLSNRLAQSSRIEVSPYDKDSSEQLSDHHRVIATI